MQFDWLEFNVPFQHEYGFIRDEEFDANGAVCFPVCFSNSSVAFWLTCTDFQHDSTPYCCHSCCFRATTILL